MKLTVMVQNLLFGGVLDGDDGRPSERWPLLVERVLSARPDVLLLTEAVQWGQWGHRLLARAMEAFDMDALLPAPSASGVPVVVMFRRETMGRWTRWNTDYGQLTTHGFGVAAFEVDGLTIDFAACHLNPFSADLALQEVSVVSNRAYRYSPLAVIGGDINYPPDTGPEPLFAAMTPYNRSMRTVLHDPAEGAGLSADRRVGWKLRQAGFHDAAALEFDRRGDATVLERTCNQDRVDQIWVTESLAPAVVDYWAVHSPQGASDHSGVVTVLDTSLVDRSACWSYQ